MTGYDERYHQADIDGLDPPAEPLTLKHLTIDFSRRLEHESPQLAQELMESAYPDTSHSQFTWFQQKHSHPTSEGQALLPNTSAEQLFHACQNTTKGLEVHHRTGLAKAVADVIVRPLEQGLEHLAQQAPNEAALLQETIADTARQIASCLGSDESGYAAAITRLQDIARELDRLTPTPKP